MQQKVDQYLEIGQFLQDGIMLEKLETYHEQLNEEQFFIPIIGQFSSGKSSLINNLLGRRFLPTMLSETTAYTTFISYGESEYAEIVTDLVSYQFPIDKLMELSQRNLQKETSVSEILDVPRVKNTDILCIRVYVNHPMLKTGIVFVDTPGLNTILSTHENRTMGILPKAHAILYVMGKALTAADVRLMASIDQMGIDLIFVRTKIDQLRKDENDTPQKVMAEDKEQLEQAIGRTATYFGVTNEEELLEYPHWKVLLQAVNDYFENEFVGNLAQQREKSIERRLAQVKTHFLDDLTDRKQQLELSKTVTDQDIQKKVTSLEQEMDYVQDRMKSQEKNFKLTFNATKQTILDQYAVQYELTVQQYRNTLAGYTTIDALQQAADTIAEQQISASMETLKVETNERLNDFLQKATAQANELLVNQPEPFALGNLPNVHLQVEVPTISEVFEQGEYIQQKIDTEVLYDDKLLEIQKQREQVEVQVVGIHEEMQAAQQDMHSLGDYEARYIEKHNNDKQETLSKLGNVVDWALVFIPGKAFTTGAAKAATLVNKVAKGTKYVEQAAKVATKIEKAGKVLAKTDKVKDFMKTVDKLEQSGQRMPNQDKGFSIFNMLSLEYWFGQAGKVMDGPPQIVEDEQYRQAYMREKEAIHAKIEHTKQLELMRMQQMDLLNNREEKLREEMRLKEKYEQQMKQQLYEAERKHEEKLKEQQVAEYRKQLIAHFELQMKQLFAGYESNVVNYLDRFISHMPSVISLNLQKQLHTQKLQLEELVATRQQNKELQVAYEQQLLSYIQVLKG